jgi:NADH-quinone oxidoreductase subunit A
MTVSLASATSVYGPLVVLVVIALVFGVGNVILSRLLGPARTGSVKAGVYESGVNPVGTARKRFNVRFYIVAMTFLVFDVEIVFLYPWATVLPNLDPADPLGLQFLFRMFFFIATSIVAYVYAWRKGVFRYD